MLDLALLELSMESEQSIDEGMLEVVFKFLILKLPPSIIFDTVRFEFFNHDDGVLKLDYFVDFLEKFAPSTSLPDVFLTQPE